MDFYCITINIIKYLRIADNNVYIIQAYKVQYII